MYDIEVLKGTRKGILKQYELLAGFYDSEMSRFWVRFNIFVGMEFAGLIAMVINPKFLVANPHLMCALLLFCALFSMLVVLMVIRGISSARLLPKLISRIEAKSEDLAEIIELTRKLDPLPQYINFLIALGISGLFSVLWWLAFVFYGLGLQTLEVPK